MTAWRSEKTRYPLAEAREFAAHLHAGMPAGLEYHVCGSYRRRAELGNERLDIGDLDIVIITRHGVLAEAALPADFRPQSHGEKETLGDLVLPDGRSIHADFWAVTPEARGAALLYATGPQSLTIRMRSRARKRGLKLNQEGLFAGPRRRDDGTEESIFAMLGMSYENPAVRDRWSAPGPDALIVMVPSGSGGRDHRVRLDGVHADCDCKGFNFYRECGHVLRAREMVKCR